MNEAEQRFQKHLVILQVIATALVAFGAVMTANGFSLELFSAGLGIGHTGTTDTGNAQNLSEAIREWGWGQVTIGTAIIVFTTVVATIAGFKIKVRQGPARTSKTAILVDEMYDGYDSRLAERGYEVQSVRKLRFKGLPLRSDFSVLKYAEKHGMILVTEDRENAVGCEENDLRCIQLGQNPPIEEMIKAIEDLEGS